MMPQEQQLLRQLIERSNRLERRVTLLDTQEGGAGAVVSVNGNTGVVVLDSDDIAEGVTNLYLTQERVEDYVAAQFVGNTGRIDATYNDTTGAITLTLDVSAADKMLYSTAADTWAEATLTSFARTLLDDTDAAAMRGTLGLVIGTNVQAYDAELAALAALTSAADRLPYFTGSGTAALATFTSAARDLLDDANAAAMRTTIGAVGLTGNETVAGNKTFEGNTVLQTTTAMGYPVILVNRNVTATTAPLGTFGLRLTTTGEMTDTFGPRFLFEANDATLSTQNLVGAIAVQRNGADNSFDMSFQTASGGTLADKVWITTGGDLSIGTASAGARLHVLESTLGDEVMRLTSTATNDDPRESVYQARGTTTSVVTGTIFTLAIPASTTVAAEAVVVARRTGGTSGTAEDGAAYIVRGVWKNVAGTATIIGSYTTTVIGESQAAWHSEWSESGSDAVLWVTGAANNNITWHATIRAWRVGS